MKSISEVLGLVGVDVRLLLCKQSKTTVDESMISVKEGTASGDRFSGVVIAAAILVAIATAVALLSANADAMRKLRFNQSVGTDVPISGALLGQESLGGPEWKATGADEEVVIMFGVAANGAIGDREFWEEVAALSTGEAAQVQFVGLCASGSECHPQAGSKGLLTVLKVMDLAQFHVLSTAGAHSNSVIYRGGRFVRVLPLQEDRQAFAKAIVEAISGQPANAGGA